MHADRLQIACCYNTADVGALQWVYLFIAETITGIIQEGWRVAQDGTKCSFSSVALKRAMSYGVLLV